MSETFYSLGGGLLRMETSISVISSRKEKPLSIKFLANYNTYDFFLQLAHELFFRPETMLFKAR